jgi:cell wall-associated NlpC family hydrolase
MNIQAVIDEAMSWLNTPYHHSARLKGAGADCGQFPAAVFKACGLIPELDIGYYPHDWHMHRDDERYLEIVERHFEKTDVPNPGCLALFKYGRAISHGSIIIEWPLIIHAYIAAGAVVLDDAEANQELASRLMGFWQLSVRS